MGAYGNLINRTLVFAEKNFDGKVPNGVEDKEIKEKLEYTFKKASEHTCSENIRVRF